MINRPRCIIGLTGGIATGKTTVSQYLATQYELPVLDTDIYAREAVVPGSPILTRILQRYGSEVELADGSLNRRKLGEIIFTNAQERSWLEGQIHPFVKQRCQEEIARTSASTVVLVVPLLFEAGMEDLVTEIWVVYCSYQEQIRRIQARDRLSLQRAQARVRSQMPIARKIKLAQVVLDNSQGKEFLYQQVDAVMEKK